MINKRVRRFWYTNGLLYRVFTDGSRREIPRLAERTDIVRKLHDDAGHFGIKRTTSLVETEYWRHGMYEKVRLYVRSCDSWTRVKASFVPRDVVLHPLPIVGMFYRWSVVPAGPFPQSEYGNYYIMVMIEHYSKWEESCECSASMYCAGTERQLRC